MRLVLVLLGLVTFVTPLAAQNDSVLRRAMQDELARSMQGLHLDTMPRPYFIAYRIDESDVLTVAASRGSLLHRNGTRGRVLTVEVRVGDYTFDNTNFFAMPTGSDFVVLEGGWEGGNAEIPLDDDYGVLRRQLWLATDIAYKEALEQYSRKRAAQTGSGHTPALPDFSRDSVATTTDTISAPAPSADAAIALARRLSLLLRDAHEIERSEVSVTAQRQRTIYLNSEGSSFTRSLPNATVRVDAVTRAADGMPLGDTWTARAATVSDLPSPDSLSAATRGLVTTLIRRRAAVTADVYHGPVLLSGAAAAQVFRTVIGSRLIAVRRPTSDIPAFEAMAARHQDPFLDELGARVLPKFLSVSDNPTLTTFAGHFVGGFRVDDDGVRTHETRIVDHGILKTLLSTRVPVRGVPSSSGNRHEDRPVVSTMIVTPDSGLPDAALRQRLLSLVAERGLPYGIIVRRVGGAALSTMDNPFAMMAGMAERMQGTPSFETSEAVRLYPDGHEEQIRGATVADLSLPAFRDIVAASRTQTVYSAASLIPDLPAEVPAFFRIRAALGYPSTYVVPDLLFEELSVKATGDEVPPRPVVPPPWANAHSP